jgi:hypothetical protein
VDEVLVLSVCLKHWTAPLAQKRLGRRHRVGLLAKAPAIRWLSAR